MKFLLVLLSLFVLCSFSYGQEYRLWVEDFEAVAAGTDDSNELNLTDRYTTVGKYYGLTSIVLDIDSSTTASGGGDDSLYFVTMYKVSGTWFTGDTIQWSLLKTAAYMVDDAFATPARELIIAEVAHDSLYIWNNDPTSTTTIEGYPLWQEFGLRMLHNDSVSFSLDVRAGRH